MIEHPPALRTYAHLLCPRRRARRPRCALMPMCERSMFRSDCQLAPQNPNTVVVMSGLFRFEHVRAGGLHWHVMHALGSDIVEPLWPGLWELEYSDDPRLNPFLRFGINNGEGESLAVWRALAWAMTEGTSRVGLPCYYRDDAARNLGKDRTEAILVPWEYEVDLELGRFAEANMGFVPARSCVQISPPPDEWERDHQRFAGLFDLSSFGDLTELERAVGFDATSEISMFGLKTRDASALGSILHSKERPVLSEVLVDGDVFVDLSLTRDRFPGTHSFLSFAAHHDLSSALNEKTLHFESQWATYLREFGDLTTLDGFSTSMERLLRMPSE